MKRLFLLFSFAVAAFAQQNAVLLPWTPQQFTNTNGTLLVSGKVCTYIAGTSTGQATYTDSTATVSNSVPPNAVLLDSTGRPTSGGIWLKVGLAYKIVVMTAGSDSTCNTGITVKSQDNVTAGNAFLTGNNTFSGTNVFATLNNVCVVDGTTHVSIGACYAALPSAGGQIYLPAGTYTQALGAITISKLVRIICEDPKTTTINFTGASGVGLLFNYDGSGSGLGSLSDWAGGSVEYCNISGPSAGTAIQLGDATHASIGFSLTDSRINGFAIGVTWGNGNSWAFKANHDVFTSNTQDIVYNLSTGVGCADCWIEHTAFQGSQQTNAIQFAGTLGGHFIFADDFFGDEPITISTSNGWLIEFHNGNFEDTVNTTNSYITMSGGGGALLRLAGLNLFQQVLATGGLPTQFITLSGGTLTAQGIYASSAQTMAAIVAISGSANLDLEVTRSVNMTANISGTTTGALTFQTPAADFFRKQFASTLSFTEIGAQSNLATGFDLCYGDNAYHGIKCSFNNQAFSAIPLIGLPQTWTAAQTLSQVNLTNLLLSNTAPTISTHFNTSGDSIVVNGTGSFTITVGTGTGTSTGALTLPTAANGWNCWLQNQSRADLIQQTGSTTASATFTNFGTTFAATNWTNSDVLRGGCTAN